MRTAVRSIALVLAIALAAIPGPSGVVGAGGTDASTRSRFASYVALGDSFTAGPLIPDLVVAGGCFRSTRNYPALLARRLGVSAFTDVSCSGADTTDMTQSQQTALGVVPPQLDSLDRDTDLVTLSVGGNDFSVFSRLVTVCPSLRASDPTGAPCRRRLGGHRGDALLSDVARTRGRIAGVVREVRRRAPHAQVLLVGYPRLAPPDGTCPERLPLADGDYDYATRVERALNAAMRRAAHEEGAEYVDMFGRSLGHDICATDPWVNGQDTDRDAAAAYHPFAAEMVAVADAVQARLRRGH